MARRSPRAWVLFALLLLAATVLTILRPDGGAAAATRRGMVTGLVTRSAACPVIRAERPCPTYPVPGAQVSLLRNGHVVATQRSDADGRYGFTTRAGAVVVRATARAGFGGYVARTSRTATVHAGRTTHLRLLLDRGIR
jgi:hypothetical protein